MEKVSSQKEIEQKLFSLPRYGKSPHLGRMKTLLSLLGHPEKAFPSILIGGTNGKGSVAALCQAILSAAGYRVGLYTSPHLYSFCERYRLGERKVSKKEFLQIFPTLWKAVQKVSLAEEPPSGFEAFTALAFLLFSHWKVDIAVLEVGIGGRLDPTNLSQPVVTVITNIGDDHKDLLGESERERLWEKAGILRKGVPLFSGVEGELRGDLEAIAEEKGSFLYLLGRDFQGKVLSRRWEGQEVEVTLFSGEKIQVFTPLLGDFQRDNLAIAVNVCKSLEQHGFSIPLSAIQKGCERVSWPGRLEVLSFSPLVVVDCAHNLSGVQALCHSLQKMGEPKKWKLLVGISEDKPYRAMLEALRPLGREMICSEASYRALSAKVLADTASDLGFFAKEMPCLQEAFEAISLTPQEGLLITGGLFFAAEARKILGKTSLTILGLIH